MFSQPPGPQAQPAVQQDVLLIVSGNFSEDALGPDNYRAILARLAAAPREYLEAFRALVRERTDAGRLSTLHLPWFLKLLARTDPGAARGAARELLPAYESAAREVEVRTRQTKLAPGTSAAREPARPETETDKQADRLRHRVAELERLLNP
jgi:hypothetical protein